MQKIIGRIALLVVFVILVVLVVLVPPPPTTQATVGDITIDQSVGGSSTLGIVTAQKLVDTANSAYFIDPAATGNALVIAGTATISGTIESTTGGFKFPDGSTQTAAAAAIPAGLVSFFNLASCPTGWTELTAARGMTVVGLPASGTLAGTVGTAFTNLENRTHTHTGPSHTHNQNGSATTTAAYGGQVFASSVFNSAMNQGTGVTSAITMYSGVAASGTDATGASGTGATGTAATSNVAPYIQLLACQKS